MKRINVYGVSANVIVSYALAMMVALRILTNTNTSAFPSENALSLFAAPTIANGDGDRDKSGTSAVQIKRGRLQTPQFAGVMKHDANVTERGRFRERSALTFCHQTSFDCNQRNFKD
jgi:hypothetical protein